MIEHMIDESLRAAEVVRRLRDFFVRERRAPRCSGTAEPACRGDGALAAKAAQSGVDLAVETSPSFALFADRLQLRGRAATC